MNRVAAMKLEKMARVDLPWPPRDLSPNRSRNVHWSKKSKTVRDYKAACISCCQEAKLHLKKHELVANGLKIRVTYEIYPPDKRRRDLDNIIGSLKAAQDAISSVVGVDDNHFAVTYVLKEGTVDGGLIDVRLEQAK
jgi:crossover junction endodeoxyribonuclease RusA